MGITKQNQNKQYAIRTQKHSRTSLSYSCYSPSRYQWLILNRQTKEICVNMPLGGICINKKSRGKHLKLRKNTMKEISLINNATFQQKLLAFLEDLGMPLDYTQCEYIVGNLIQVTYDRGNVKTVLTLTYKEESNDE